jgi:hypothetical protein
MYPVSVLAHRNMDNPTGKQIVAGLKRTGYVKKMFNSPEKKEFIDPLFLIVIPVMLQIMEELGNEQGFEFIYSDSFKSLLQATVVNQATKHKAKVEVEKLVEDLGIVLKGDSDERSKDCE